MKQETLDWLMEEESPGARYLALRDLVRLPPDDPQLIKARTQAHTAGPIAEILDQMRPDGYWEQPGPGYLPKYRSTVWSLITLAQLGASISMDERVQTACGYILAHALTPQGQFSGSGAPGGTADCLQGNLCWSLLELGCPPERLQGAYEWMARSLTGEGVAPMGQKEAPLRYYAGKIGPNFACGANNKLPCAWGAVKVALAFSRWPQEMRTPLIQRAIQQTVDFFFSTNPVRADYPCGWAEKPSGNWWKFGFPVYYVTDLLQLAEALVGLGCGGDPRLRDTLDFIAAQKDADGRFALQYDYTGKTWVDFGARKQPNKWVTLRAWRMLKNAAAG